MNKTLTLKFKSPIKKSIKCFIPSHAFKNPKLAVHLDTFRKFKKGNIVVGVKINECGDFFDFSLDDMDMELFGMDSLNWESI